MLPVEVSLEYRIFLLVYQIQKLNELHSVLVHGEAASVDHKVA